MTKKLSQRTHLGLLSKATNISKDVLKRILDDNYTTRQSSFTKNESEQKSTSIPFMRTKSLSEQINETESVKTLYGILSNITYNTNEYVVCFEKLVRVLKTDMDETDDVDELIELSGYSPDGSPIESEIIDKIIKLQIEDIDDEDDLDELCDLYEKNNLYKNSEKHLIEKILRIANTPEKIFKVVDEVFAKDSPEFYDAKVKHSEVVTTAINTMKRTDDSDDIAEYLYLGSNEELLLASKIVEIGKNTEDILDREEDFENDSEAHEILVLGAIGKYNDYYNDHEEIDSLINDWSEGSKVNRFAEAKKRELLITYCSKMRKTDDMLEMLDEFDKGDPEKKKLEARIVENTEDLDELVELTDSDNSNISSLAKTKLSSKIVELIENITISKGDSLNEYIQDESVEKDLLDAKLVDLAKTDDDVDTVYDIISGNSYSEYMLSKKFSNNIPTAITVPPVQATPVQPVVNTDQQDNNEQMKRRISSNRILGTAIDLYNSLLDGDTNKVFAHEKMIELLSFRINYSKNKEEMLELLKMFSKESIGYMMIVKKLASYYNKPFWMFW